MENLLEIRATELLDLLHDKETLTHTEYDLLLAIGDYFDELETHLETNTNVD